MQAQLRAMSGLNGRNQVTGLHPITQLDQRLHRFHADEDSLRGSKGQHASGGNQPAKAHHPCRGGNDVRSRGRQVETSVAWTPGIAGRAEISQDCRVALGGPLPDRIRDGREEHKKDKQQGARNHPCSVSHAVGLRQRPGVSGGFSGWSQGAGQLR